MTEATKIPIDDDCLNNLHHTWTHLESPTMVFLDGAAGSGSRQIIRQLQHAISDDCLTWHLRCIPDEFGEVLLPKILGGLWKGIWKSDGISKRMASVMHSTLPMLEDVEDQKRMQVLIDSLRIYREFGGEKIVLPDNRPLLSLVQLGSIFGQIDPLLLIFEDIHLSYSPLLTTFLECLYKTLPDDCKVLTIMTTDRKVEDPSLPLGLQYLKENVSHLKEFSIQPWNYSTIQRFFKAQNLEVDGMSEEWWSGGWTGRVLELYDLHQREIQLPPLTMSFSDPTSERVIRTASLIDSTIRVDVLSRLSAVSEEACLESVAKNPAYVKTTFTDSQSNKVYIEFESSSVQIRLQENTIKQDTSLVSHVTKNIRSHIGNLSPTYQVQSIYLLGQINKNEELNQQHRDLLAQERDDIWLQILDLRMRFDIKWSNALEGYMYVGAIRYLSKLDLPNLQMSFEEALRWAKKEQESLTEMELYTIMIDYHLQQGDVDQVRKYWENFVEIAEEQRNSEFLFRKEIFAMRLESIGITKEIDIHEILQSVENPIQKITLIRIYVSQKNRNNRKDVLHLGYEISKSAQFEKTTIDLGLQYLELFLEDGEPNSYSNVDVSNMKEIQEVLQSKILETTSDWERLSNLCSELGL